ncbi:MAG: FAD-binding protein, partial [Gammaproteobacteria bacterium]|nr:FAD-binding protein [Gammaproteobacteria bacterium]
MCYPYARAQSAYFPAQQLSAQSSRACLGFGDLIGKCVERFRSVVTVSSENSAVNELGFDPDALREKYRVERDKRLRSDGSAQYQEVVGDFSHYVDDPYVESGFSRAPLEDQVDVIVIGGGFGGLLSGARLTEAGVGSVRIIEKGGDFGGTWYWNR